MSGTFSGPSPCSQGDLQSEFLCYCLYPFIIPVRASSFDTIVNRSISTLTRQHIYKPVPSVRKFNRAAADLQAFLVGPVTNCQTAVLPIATVLHDLRTQRVALDVPQHGQIMLVRLHGKTLKPPLIDVPYPCCPVRRMPSLCMRQCYPSHKLRNIAGLARPQQQVPVIAHNAVTAKPHPHAIHPLSQHPLKRLEVRTLLEYPQPPIGTVANVVNNTTSTLSFRARHNKMKNNTNSPNCQQKKGS